MSIRKGTWGYRGWLSPAQKAAILALGDHGRPATHSELSALMSIRTYGGLERRGFAFFGLSGVCRNMFWLTDSGADQYGRLKLKRGE